MAFSPNSALTSTFLKKPNLLQNSLNGVHHNYCHCPQFSPSALPALSLGLSHGCSQHTQSSSWTACFTLRFLLLPYLPARGESSICWRGLAMGRSRNLNPSAGAGLWPCRRPGLRRSKAVSQVVI